MRTVYPSGIHQLLAISPCSLLIAVYGEVSIIRNTFLTLQCFPVAFFASVSDRTERHFTFFFFKKHVQDDISASKELTYLSYIFVVLCFAAIIELRITRSSKMMFRNTS